jgi:arylsulfatase A-like enzyme
MRSDRSRAFDLSHEPSRVRDSYGRHSFGQGCLLARRLVEAGVSCVEVYLANWDSHERATADGVRSLLTQVDDGVSALLRDLEQRGMLQDTLIIWMGEFGRTPQMNRNGGRDHFARAWSTVLFGGGVKGGQAVGATDAQGGTVRQRPISVYDFMATVCRLLGIDPTRRIDTPVGRPIRIVEDHGEQVISEVF